jgi:hypothetical protein
LTRPRLRERRLGAPACAFAVLLALGAAPGALAQEGAGGPNWAGPIAEAFFGDAGMTELRPRAELLGAWEALSEADKAQVRRDCAAMAADAGDQGGAASGGVSDVNPAAAEPGAAAEGSETALGEFPAGGSPAMAEACALVVAD